METLQAIFGLFIFCAIAWCMSENRRALPFPTLAKTIAIGIGIQFLLAMVLLKIPFIANFVMQLNDLVAALERATTAGTSFVFGYLGGGKLPFAEKQAGASFILAFRALPVVLLVSALSALLFYWRVLPCLVRLMARFLQRIFGIGGALGITAAANVFIGMVESPLLVRPYIKRMTRSELFAMMSVGMATIAGTVMALYATILRPIVPDAIGHILIASIVSAPAALLLAHLMVPPEGDSTEGELAYSDDEGGTPQSAMDAVTIGTVQGVKLLINIAAMLVVMVAMVHLCNLILGLLPEFGGNSISLQRVFGWVFAPLAWAMGVPWSEAAIGGELLGFKTVLNELIAYVTMAQLPAGALSEKSQLIMVYALCGFANFGSLGIMLGGLLSMAPDRRAEIVALGPRTIVSGLLATCMTGAVVGLIL
ncbi:MAG TPA: nucleoside:proton symporter [Rhodospirillaceae bacterium]|nr:nucleoside:proton symporter [Rhodospirillaceae bacterium]HAA90925.1 nucleoside:proton symporter [Rhodospirillaceae bacterium]HAT35687.1 nucleoside:proton symporter [Rhodospirillaceae bacterium]